MMILIFHGYLRKLFPEGRLSVEANSAAEALLSLEGRPGFRRDLGEVHQVTLPDFQSPDAIYSLTEKTEVHVVPALEGAAGGFQIVIGAILVAVGYLTDSPKIIQAGIMMMLGGVLQMMMPQPTISNDTQLRSNYLPANGNTVRIGTPIPLLVGRRRVYGQYLSFNVEAKTRDAVLTAPAASTSQAWVDSGALYGGAGGGD